VDEVSYKGHQYPAEIIAHCVWLYHPFPLSFREVEDLMLVYANRLRRHRARPGDKWHLDEVLELRRSVHRLDQSSRSSAPKDGVGSLV